LMELAPHIPIERCRLVQYNYVDKVMDHSFDLDEFQHQTIRQLVLGGARGYYSFALFLETRKENEIFSIYKGIDINLEVSVVDLSTGEVGPAKQVRGYDGWTVEKLKQHIGELYNIDSSHMRLVVMEEEYEGTTSIRELRNGHNSYLYMALKLDRVIKCETVTFIFDWKPEEHLLQDIKGVLSKVSGKLLIIKFIATSTSISVTCSFPFSDVGFTVLRMIENIHILMGQGLKKLTIGNLTLWRRQDDIQKELKEKDQDLLQHTEVISYIILEEAEYKLRDTISIKEKETMELKQELSKIKVLTELEAKSLPVQIEVEEEPLYEELTVLRSQFNEIQKENKKLSDKISKMKIEYLRSLTSNTDSAACRVSRGMTFEIDDCKFHLKAMTRSDYQPLVDNKRIIEELQERITLMNMELMTVREHNEKIIKDIKDHLKEIEEKRQKEKKQKTEEKPYEIDLYCNHPVTGKLVRSTLKVHKDELLPSVLDKAYELMELAPHILIERCRLVKYNYVDKVMDQPFDLDEFQHQTIRQLVLGGARGYYSFALFLETRKENETFKKYIYKGRGINLKVSVVDLSTGEVGPAKPVRGEEGWTVAKLKQHIGEILNIDSSYMRLLVMEKEYMYGGATSIHELRDGHSSKLDGVKKEALVPLIGVRPTGFIVYGYKTKFGSLPSSDHEEYEMEELDETFKDGSKLIVRLGRGLGRGEKRIKLYLLQVNNTEFCKFMMDTVYAKGTPVGEFKKQIIEEAKVQGIDCVLELDKMRLWEKNEVYPGMLYLDHDWIGDIDDVNEAWIGGTTSSVDDTNREIHVYVEPLKGPEKKYDAQTQVYVIRWRPSQCSVDPTEEIILDKYNDSEHVIGKLSELSGVPAEYISYTEVKED
uniref:Ubiquitin carboxyl-terminal hydrolase 47 C-terminal domain-containing protein n=1 Tax=Amphimedon queenslandica TaxID=400682 RepID=A0A1X7U7D4_AMPQE